MAISPGAQRLDEVLGGRAVLLGIGNRWRGDDGAGPAVIDRVRGHVSTRCIDAGEAPERHLGEATASAPEAIVLLDAVDFGGAPGEVAVFNLQDLPRRLGTTHDVPLRTLMHYLRAVSGADVLLIGVQPADTAFGSGLSTEVRAAVDRIADLLIGRYGRPRAAPGSAGVAAHAADEEGGESHRWN